jgi:hypothetical protein
VVAALTYLEDSVLYGLRRAEHSRAGRAVTAMTDAERDEWHQRLRAQLAEATAKRQRSAALRAQLAEARTAGKAARHLRRTVQIQRRLLAERRTEGVES